MYIFSTCWSCCTIFSDQRDSSTTTDSLLSGLVQKPFRSTHCSFPYCISFAIEYMCGYSQRFSYKNSHRIMENNIIQTSNMWLKMKTIFRSQRMILWSKICNGKMFTVSNNMNHLKGIYKQWHLILNVHILVKLSGNL